MKEKIINYLWIKSQQKDFNYFLKNVANVKDIQKSILFDYIHASRKTKFGINHHFGRIKTYQDFVSEVPIIEDLLEINSYIIESSEGKSNILFPDKPKFFESTSGSTSASKLIPYTNRLKKEFQKSIAVWMSFLYRDYPRAFDGKSYWSLSPPLKDKWVTSGGIQVGIEDDSEYLNPISAYLIKQTMAVDSSILKIKDSHNFYMATWIALLSCKKLSFISVWSPSFLMNLILFLRQNSLEIKKYLTGSHRDFIWETPIKELTLKIIFPELQLISCWTQGQSKIWLTELKELTGDILMQGKGLLSTEGVVSIPINKTQMALSYISHFYEFKSKNGLILLAEDLIVGQQYEVIMTTGGGLFRYNTHDLVVCVGFTKKVPLLDFIGRSNNTSDIVGEKVSEAQIINVFSEILKSNRALKNLFLCPTQKEESAYYILLIEERNDVNKDKILLEVEANLNRNPYYKQAIEIGQLKPLTAIKVEAGFGKKYLKFYKKNKSIKDGDVKLPILLPLNYYSGHKRI